MNKTIDYKDTLDPSNNELSIIDDLSIPYTNIENELYNIFQSESNRKIRQQLLIGLANSYISKLGELKNTRNEISNTKHAKDKILYKVIENAKPPVSLKWSMFNYKALVLYFMHNFRDTTIIELNTLINNADNTHSDVNKLTEIFSTDNKLRINTHLDTLLHLINIDKGNSKSIDIIESMIYETINFGDKVKNESLFKNKIASISWVKDTINNPDFIYCDENIIATNLKFELGSFRETGKGTASEPYMYHFVGMNRINGRGKYTLVSQFPIEKDRIATKNRQDDKKVSTLHNFVQCNKPIYLKQGKEIPLYDEGIVTNESATVDRLNRGFGNRL